MLDLDCTAQARHRLPRLPINRRKFFGLAAAAGIGGLGADTVLFEPNHPRLVRQEIALRRWPAALDGFTIALLSDFHYDPVFSVHPIRNSIATVNDLRPDLIVLTGDFVSVPPFGDDAKAARAAEPCAQILRQLRCPHGLWAVLGNHDVFTDPDFVAKSLQQADISVLNNQSVPIEKNGARFWLAGVDDVLGGTADVRDALQHVSAPEAVVLLAHEPDYADHVSRFPVDLQLSGHTHGGQIRFPLVPPLFLPELGRKYISGLYKIRGLTLYTNPGLGTIGIPARLNCPPEITLISIRSADSTVAK